MRPGSAPRPLRALPSAPGRRYGTAVPLRPLVPLVLVLLALPIAGAGCRPDAVSPPASGSSSGTGVPRDRPSVLLVVADDLGYADVGAYGSEISTPHIDRLAREGIQLTDFHVAATCSPTRAMLLTGVDNNVNGLGAMATFLPPEQRGRPGYEGHLNDRVVTLAERLRDAGYDTYFSGKWHLGDERGQWPVDRGFARSYALLEGSGDNYGDTGPAPVLPRVHFVEDHRRVERGDRFSSRLYTDALLDQLGPDREGWPPFFAVLSFQAVHWPHQAPREYIERYEEVYAAGWDVLRAERFARMKDMGLVASDLELPPRASGVPAWEALPRERRTREARRMAAYAGMTTHMDHEIGRVLARIRQLGMEDETLVVFVSDNGPDASEPDQAPRARAWYAANYPDDSLRGIGGPGSFASYGPGWAQLGTVHLREFKGSAYEGGLRVPFIARWPSAIEAGGRSDAFAHATDLVPTILEATGVTEPGDRHAGRAVEPPTGRSLWPTLRAPARAVHPEDEGIGYSLMKSRALFRGGLKLVRNGPPAGDGEWQLYDLRTDPAERRDLATDRPERLARMTERHRAWADRHGVVPMPDDFDVFRALTSGREAPRASTARPSRPDR